MTHHPEFGNTRCAFCQQLERLDREYINGRVPIDVKGWDAAVIALFDQADRATAARRKYGRKHGYHR